jgi:putative acetyltransferase
MPNGLNVNRTKYVLKRTDASNNDFRELVKQLNEHLALAFGVQQKYYDQFNDVENNSTVIIAYENAVPVGCGCLRKFDTETVELKRMFVPPRYRGRGVATEILQGLEEWAKELNFNFMILETGTLLTEANNLYQKHQYEVIPNWGQYVGIKTSVCMKKALK